MLFTRRARTSDLQGISNLITSCGGTSKFRQRYGAFNLANLLEHGYLALVTCDSLEGSGGSSLSSVEESSTVCCFVVFSDGPRGAADKAEEWLAGVEACVGMLDMQVWNTLWVEFSASSEGELGRQLWEMTLKEALRLQPRVDHVLLTTQCSEVSVEMALELGLPSASSTASQWRLVDTTRSQCEAVSSRVIYYASREAWVPTLLVRDASVEDSDDLLPVLERQSEALARHFGEFYLAEMIEAQDDANRALVATLSERALGLLAVTTEVDVQLLERCFELEPFDNLRSRPSSSSSSSEPGVNAFAVTLFCLEEEHASRAVDFFQAAFALYPDREYCVLTAPPETWTATPLLGLFAPVPARVESTFSHSLFMVHRDAVSPRLSVARFDPEAHGSSGDKLCRSAGVDLDSMLEPSRACASEPLSENPQEVVFAAVVRDQVVAVAALSRRRAATESLNWLKANYQVEDHVPVERHRARCQVFLTSLVLNPLFVKQARFLLKECMRHLDNKTLLYHLAEPDSVPCAVLYEMTPIKARWRPDPGPDDPPHPRASPPPAEDTGPDINDASSNSPNSPNSPKSPASRPDEPGRPLHFFARRFASDHTPVVNSRIVVVGMTTCAVGFFRELLLSDQVRCANVTLIAPQGLSWDLTCCADQEAAQKNLLEPPNTTHQGLVSPLRAVDEDMPAPFEMEALGLPHRVRVIRAQVAHIDRENRAVALPDGAVVPYDNLVLASGLEESTKHRLCPVENHATILTAARDTVLRVAAGLESLDPNNAPNNAPDAEDPDAEDPDAEDPNAEDPNASAVETCPGDPLNADGTLDGVVSVGTLPDEDLASAALLAAEANGVVVYGGTLDALACVAGLVERGVQPLTLVVPSASLETLGDTVVDRLVKTNLDAAAVDVCLGLRLDDRNGLVRDDDGNLVALRLVETSQEPQSWPDAPRTHLNCSLLVGADLPDLPIRLFSALNEAGLVVDGRLVVDANFRTSDPAVYAAGPVAKFSDVHKKRKARNGGGLKALYHESANQLEVGAALALALVARLDKSDRQRPTQYAADDTDYTDDPLPLFLKPKTVSAILPGKLRYARSTLPFPPADAKLMPTGLLRGDDDTPDQETAHSRTTTTTTPHPETAPEADLKPDFGTTYTSASQRNLVVDSEKNNTQEDTKKKLSTPSSDCCEPPTGLRALRHLAHSRHRYTVLKLDMRGVAFDLVYLGRHQVEPRNLAALVGLHEAYLNAANASYDRGLVDDWIDFFRQDWATALRYDRFTDLRVALADILAYDDGARNIIQRLLGALRDGKDDVALNTLRDDAIGIAGTNLPQSTQDLLHNAVLGYLRKNRVLLPRFLLPDRNAASTATPKPAASAAINASSTPAQSQ